MKKDKISTPENVEQLRTALQKLTYNTKFGECKNMGDIVETGIDFIVKNYKKYV